MNSNKYTLDEFFERYEPSFDAECVHGVTADICTHEQCETRALRDMKRRIEQDVKEQPNPTMPACVRDVLDAWDKYGANDASIDLFDVGGKLNALRAHYENAPDVINTTITASRPFKYAKGSEAPCVHIDGWIDLPDGTYRAVLTRAEPQP